MRIDFDKIGPSKIYLDTNNKEYIILCDVLGNVYKVKREEIVNTEFKPESKAISVMGIPINKFKSILNITFIVNDEKNSDNVEKIAAYSSVDKDKIESAFIEVNKWIKNKV